MTISTATTAALWAAYAALILAGIVTRAVTMKVAIDVNRPSLRDNINRIKTILRTIACQNVAVYRVVVVLYYVADIFVIYPFIVAVVLSVTIVTSATILLIFYAPETYYWWAKQYWDMQPMEWPPHPLDNAVPGQMRPRVDSAATAETDVDDDCCGGCGDVDASPTAAPAMIEIVIEK